MEINTNVYFDSMENAEVLLVQPMDTREMTLIESELAYIRANVTRPFAFLAIEIKDWFNELSPWKAPAVFGKESFGDGAKETLAIMEQMVEEILEKFNTIQIGQERVAAEKKMPVILGGYSLAGLFALWASTRSDTFARVNAASPSVWFPDWNEYVARNPLKAEKIYLSLGDREAKTKNPVMATVADSINYLHEIEPSSFLEWNEGNHFKEPEIRTAKGFVWCINN